MQCFTGKRRREEGAFPGDTAGVVGLLADGEQVRSHLGWLAVATALTTGQATAGLLVLWPSQGPPLARSLGA